MSDQQHTSLGVFFSVLDSVGLVLIGVFATQIDQPVFLIALILVAAMITVSRFFLTVTSRRDASEQWLKEYLSDSSDLEDTLRGLSSRGLKNPWSRGDLLEAIDWWFHEDLVNDWYRERDFENHRVKPNKIKVRSLKRSLRHPGIACREALKWVERKVSGESQLQLLETVARIPDAEVARIITKAGLDIGFVEQMIGRDRLGSKRVMYTSIFSKPVDEEGIHQGV